MNYCKLDKSFLDYVVDDAPAKRGKYTPGTHVKIISWDDLKYRLSRLFCIIRLAFPCRNCKKKDQNI